MRSTSVVPIAVLVFFSAISLSVVFGAIEKSSSDPKEFQILISSTLALIAALGGICAVFINQGWIDQRGRDDKAYEKARILADRYEEERVSCAMLKSKIDRITSADEFSSFVLLNKNIEFLPYDDSYIFKVNPVIAIEYLEVVNDFNRIFDSLKVFDQRVLESDPIVKESVSILISNIVDRKGILSRFLDRIINRNPESAGMALEPIDDQTARELYKQAERFTGGLAPAKTPNSQ